MMPTLTFRSSDGRFGLLLDEHRAEELLRFARRAGRRETGGVLVGYYEHTLDRACVTQVSAPPPGSRGSGWTFERGSAGLREWLASLWNARRRTYYLGEWHFHPRASPEASGQDRAQMMALAASREYACPEPVLLILGGDPRDSWDMRAYVFPVRERGIELRRVLDVARADAQ
jgi:integrative and conjugative element protein (TIGR02256 family)